MEDARNKADSSQAPADTGESVILSNTGVQERPERLGPLPANITAHPSPRQPSRIYFADWCEKFCSWIDPRTRRTRKNDIAEIAAFELPYGWEEILDSDNQIVYYADHLGCQNYPRGPWSQEIREAVLGNRNQIHVEGTLQLNASAGGDIPRSAEPPSSRFSESASNERDWPDEDESFNLRQENERLESAVLFLQQNLKKLTEITEELEQQGARMDYDSTVLEEELNEAREISELDAAQQAALVDYVGDLREELCYFLQQSGIPDLDFMSVPTDIDMGESQCEVLSMPMMLEPMPMSMSSEPSPELQMPLAMPVSMIPDAATEHVTAPSSSFPMSLPGSVPTPSINEALSTPLGMPMPSPMADHVYHSLPATYLFEAQNPRNELTAALAMSYTAQSSAREEQLHSQAAKVRAAHIDSRVELRRSSMGLTNRPQIEPAYLSVKDKIALFSQDALNQ